MANSFSYNSIDLSGTSYGLTVLQAAMPISPSFRIDTAESAGFPGGYLRTRAPGLRTITLEVNIKGSSAADLRTKIDNINRVLNPVEGEKAIKLDHLSGRYITGVSTGMVDSPPIGLSSVNTTLIFTCSDPLFYANTETVQTITIDETPESFNVPVTGTVAGSYYAAPVYVITNSSGSTEDVELVNVTRSETLQFTSRNGDVTRFTTRTRYMEIDVLGYISGMDYLGTQRDFPLLSPGVQNAFTFTGLTAGEIEITYKSTYL